MWQYYRNDPNDNIAESEPSKCKIKITRKTAAAAGNTKKRWNSRAIKILKNFLENSWNAVN